jgi:hypothetical protein
MLLGEKPEEKRSLGRSKHRWVDKIKTALEGIEWGGMDWSGTSDGFL